MDRLLSQEKFDLKSTIFSLVPRKLDFQHGNFNTEDVALPCLSVTLFIFFSVVAQFYLLHIFICLPSSLEVNDIFVPIFQLNLDSLIQSK